VVAEVSEGQHCQIRLLSKAPGQHLHRHPSQHEVNISHLAHEDVQFFEVDGSWREMAADPQKQASRSARWAAMLVNDRVLKTVGQECQHLLLPGQPYCDAASQ